MKQRTLMAKATRWPIRGCHTSIRTSCLLWRGIPSPAKTSTFGSTTSASSGVSESHAAIAVGRGSAIQVAFALRYAQLRRRGLAAGLFRLAAGDARRAPAVG
jgi:hypothetical protein